MDRIKAVRIAAEDNVAVALTKIDTGECLQVGDVEVTACEEIPQGHKIALQSVAENENIIKYGYPIGHAAQDISPGCWVHTHNLRTNLKGEIEYVYHPAVHDLPEQPAREFAGYLRPDGRAGIRNEIWIIPTVGCVNDVVLKLARDNQDLLGEHIDGIHAFTHPFGCSQTGADHAQTRKLLAALVNHPNAGGVLVVHLGCENCTHEQFVEELGAFDPERVRFLNCQQAEDELVAGRQLLQELTAYASRFRRQSLPASKLVVGLKCGASDGLSGITANPTVGRFSDLLLSQGGSTILTEVPEMFGAEGILLGRCRNRQLFDKAAAMLNGFKDYFLSHHEVVYDNPSPGNKQGGITTLEDKSCGCVQKGGTAPIEDVLGYGEQVKKQGLNLLYGPGNDLVSSTALAAAGAALILFTTGRGTPFGSPVPTVKIATNSRLAQHKPHWIDFNAGTVAEGEALDTAGGRLLDKVLQVAGGELTCNEKNGYRQISIFKDGVVL
ncbi:putative altronate hydrolase [Selenomonas ruminantium subsp. lactilytica TAM6421]|uniref:Putative altronate hydrolase n=1 Tax=Selenomonas ruminantium subsp. lactilytica (strain NBRC 103574 / TAM6421) TaxID=927704 RepID=I0GM54_SELRL|nr:putative altronate hydrolase [Selenomonas ruminantium subsp. lactilytica TAM6421]